MAISYNRMFPQDADFCLEVHHLAMRPYIEALRGWDAPTEDRKALEFLNQEATHEIAILDGVRIGYLSYHDGPNRLFLKKLYLHPLHQGQGHGTTILTRLLGRATDKRKPVELSVLVTNPRALVFYERHGFRAIASTPQRIRMRWTP